MLEESRAEVAIEDSGPGIPADTVARLFEPFFTTKAAGMGMGLSIARTIVESHGGRIWAENCAGGGATFRFTLPIARAREAQSVASAAPATRAAPGVDASFAPAATSSAP